ncbi:APH(3') family aminoglycoside O-phosphotransferase [Paenibacillus tarimensis]
MEENINHVLPHEFCNMFNKDQVTLQWENVARTYYLQGEEGINRYLKIQPVGSFESIEVQAKKLTWLKGKLSVPEVIDYGILGNYEYLLTLEMKGSAASDKIFRNSKDEVIELVAKGLRRIHEVSVENCPFDNRLKYMMEIVRYNTKEGLINSSKLNRKFGEGIVDNLLGEIEAYATEIKEDLVFSHGDYSMPNIIISNGRISGFIDLGNCGIADRYYDLAVAEKSIIMNFGKENTDLFYRCYGIDDVDHQRVRFFQIVEFLLWG